MFITTTLIKNSSSGNIFMKKIVVPLNKSSLCLQIFSTPATSLHKLSVEEISFHKYTFLNY
jgi:hypothetical protein